MTPTGVTLSWLSPMDDGGSPVTRYVVEALNTKTGKWSEVAEVPAESTQKTITGLQEGVPYEFRVCAENEVGRGRPSILEQTITPSKPAGKRNNPLSNMQFIVSITSIR